MTDRRQETQYPGQAIWLDHLSRRLLGGARFASPASGAPR